MEQNKRSFVTCVLTSGSGVSSMRLMAFASFFVGTGLAIGGMIMGKDLGDLSILVGVFIGSAFSGKAIQKFAEKKAPPQEPYHE